MSNSGKSGEDLCCDSSNDGKSNSSSSSEEAGAAHGSPSGECLVCYEDITEDNYCEYQAPGDSRWYPCFFCYPCVQQLQQTQFQRYCDGVSRSTCAKEQRALLTRGPPVNLWDAHAFPVADKSEIEQLWVAKDRRTASAKLDGSLTGEAREKLWSELRAFLIEDEKTEDPKKQDS
ncbi:hypothetical protein, conserved [Eimeria necatrix]|uniref:Uncharacterized protein n=1 Tax=Eimeria necatrix TaxID=51315 RepID=U6N156_9EIME|nr:hypothetical protein, conserved [Eimeria necatrix]CDJ67665.1 hypothetical protein, conserved [Eimeria necatrix]